MECCQTTPPKENDYSFVEMCWTVRQRENMRVSDLVWPSGTSILRSAHKESRLGAFSHGGLLLPVEQAHEEVKGKKGSLEF